MTEIEKEQYKRQFEMQNPNGLGYSVNIGGYGNLNFANDNVYNQFQQDPQSMTYSQGPGGMRYVEPKVDMQPTPRLPQGPNPAMQSTGGNTQGAPLQNNLLSTLVRSFAPSNGGDVSEAVMGGGAAPVNASMGDMASKAIAQSSIGKAVDALSQPDASISSVYQAAQNPQMSASLDGFTQAPELRQGVLGAQQFSSGGNQNIGGIQDLLKQYGQGSQGLLPYFGNQ